VPVVSGNVSLYNETAGRPIPPTPAVGMVGLLDDVSLAVPLAFGPDACVVLLGQPALGLSAGEYAGDDAAFPHFDLQAERRLSDLLRALVARRVVRSAQDVSDGGLAMTLVECALAGTIGATIELTGDLQAALFSEDQGRAVVTCRPEHVDVLAALAAEHDVPHGVIGRTGGQRLVVEGAFDLAVADIRVAWEGQL